MKKRVLILSIILLMAIATASDVNQLHSFHPELSEQVSTVERSSKSNTSRSKGSSSRSSSGSGSGFSFLLGFVVGPILFISSFPCIWYNERKAAVEHRRITLAKQICQDVDVHSQVSAYQSNQKLVYAKGQTLTNLFISDPVCGVGGNGLIKITRKVEVLEWRHKTKKNGDEQESYYELQWASQNSSTEGQRYNNPSHWFMTNETTYNQQVYLGGYNISKEVSDLCSKTSPYHPEAFAIQNILTNVKRNDRKGQINGEYIYFTPVENNTYVPPPFDNMQVVPHSASGEQSAGTLRVKFELCPIGPISLIAKSIVRVNEGTFSSFKIAEYEGTEEDHQLPSGSLCCLCDMWKHLLIPVQEILIVQEKFSSKDELFEEAFAKSKNFAILMRLLSYVSMVLGICLFFSPITTMLGYIPLVGGFVKGVAAFAIFIGAVLFCIPLFIVGVSMAWLRFHPKIGIMVLSVGVAIFLVFWMTGGPPEEISNE